MLVDSLYLLRLRIRALEARGDLPVHIALRVRRRLDLMLGVDPAQQGPGPRATRLRRKYMVVPPQQQHRN